MYTSEVELLKILADGKLHSGQELAQIFGVSRTAIWKQLIKIKQKNLEVRSVKGKGYQLAQSLELLDKDQIRRQLKPIVQNQLTSLELYYETTSTNQLLIDSIDGNSINGRVVLTEHQSEGRGRGGNKWVGGLGAGLYFSVGWHFDYVPKTFSALSLAVGVTLAKSIEVACPARIQLKWPNDICHNDAKLGGVLIESRGQNAGAIDVVIGIGLNIRLSNYLSGLIPQKTTDLTTVSDYQPSRNLIAAVMINNLFKLLSNYPDQGFEHYIDDWRKLDISKGKRGVLNFSNDRVEGVVIDIDEYGNLLMSIDGEQHKFGGGNLTLRLKS